MSGTFRHSIAMAALVSLLLTGCGGDQGKGDLSVENLDRIRPGASLADVEKVIGAPSTRLSELRFNDFAERRRDELTRVPSGRTRYVWQHSNVLFFVDVDEPGKVVTGTHRIATAP